MSAVFDRAAMTVAENSLQKARAALDMVGRTREPDTRWNALCRQVNPQRIIAGLSTEEISGPDKEASDELDRRYRRTEPNSATIPWECLAHRAQRYAATRADIVANSSLGGYLVETVNYPSAAGALLSLLILGRLGATAINSTANLMLPRVTGSSSPVWLSTEQTSISESDLTFGQVAFTPRTVGGYTEMSRLAILQSSPDAPDTVAANLVSKIKRVIEAAAFAGSGVAGQPLGLVNLAGTNAVSGASFTLSTAMSAVGDIADALDVDSNPGWAAARSVAILLRQRTELSGSSFTLWKGPATYGQLCDYNAAASSGVPSATAIFGAWKYLTLCDFGGGLQISVNPYGSASGGGGPDASNFQRGIVGMRCLAVLDVNSVWASAFSVVSSIT